MLQICQAPVWPHFKWGHEVVCRDNREVSLYVITYENPYVVDLRAGERGQLSYVNLSTDFRRKALFYVGS